jgi:spore maturation protein SpmB
MFKKIPNGIPCLVIIVALFGYMSYVMGLTNMLNTIMHTAHDLLLNTVFYLMGMCVITGALGKIFVEFGVVDLLQRMLRPIMRPVFNMPGVASLAAVLTFLSDNPAIIALSQDKGFARYFKKYQHVSLVNFGTAFGMGLLVIVFMIGQGYFLAPFIGLFGTICGCVVATRLMQHFTLKMYPNYRHEDATAITNYTGSEQLPDVSFSQEEDEKKKDTSLFVRVLNALLDGGKDGVTIGMAIIPGVLIISTLVMMLTFGGTAEGVDQAGNDIVVYTGGAFQGTQLLPWLASKISFVFEWLFGFTAPELVAFPITALGAVGAALGLIPEFTAKGIIDGNAIAVCTAMGMCWSGYLSTDAATLDSLGYRPLVAKAFLSSFIGGICAGVIAHWVYVAVIYISTLFAPVPVWSVQTQGSLCNMPEHQQIELTMMDDSTFVVKDWFAQKGTDLKFRVNKNDSSLVITNAYAQKDDQFFFVRINEKALHGEVAYALLYPSEEYSKYRGNEAGGNAYIFAFLYDNTHRSIDRGFYELVWGNGEAETIEAEKYIQKEIEAEQDSLRLDSTYQTIADKIIKNEISEE